MANHSLNSITSSTIKKAGRDMVFIFFDNGKSVLIEDADYKKIANLSQNLHDIMESQTGGDWREFIMYMQDDGELKTQFNYDIITIMDVINRLT